VDLPRLPALRQSVRWQLAWHVGRRHVHPLGGTLRRFEACLEVMISWFHDLSPPHLPHSTPTLHMHLFPCILRRRLNCKYTYVLLLTFIHLRYALDPFPVSATPQRKDFRYYVLFSRSNLRLCVSLNYSCCSSLFHALRYPYPYPYIRIYTVTCTHSHTPPLCIS